MRAVENSLPDLTPCELSIAPIKAGAIHAFFEFFR